MAEAETPLLLGGTTSPGIDSERSLEFDSFYYSFFTIEPISLDFENLNILCLRAGDLTRLIRPHSSLFWPII
jgi:hypothetical protein